MHRRRGTRWKLLPIAVALFAGAAAAQPAMLDAGARRSVIDTITAQMTRSYVDADTGRMIAARLGERLRAGVYDSIAEPTRLAQLLTTDLRALNHDLHLSVTYATPGGTGGPRPGGGALNFLDRSNHYALGRVDVLAGNVGYFELNGFAVDPGAQDVIVSALRYLESTDAIILDLRRNRGGSGQLVNFLISHFTGPEPLASLTVKTRQNPKGTTRFTLANVPGPRRPDVPVYVLTSRSTGSAGEDCAFVLKNLKRATIIGDRTAGAGHNVTFVPSGFGFSTSISISRVSDPRTGLEWEQIGVQPDMAVVPATALDVAHKQALTTLLASASGDQRRRLELAIEGINIRATTPAR